jgi:hypothetical protein
VREPEEHRGQYERRSAANASLQKILQPSAKKQLFWNRNKEKREDECRERMERFRPV